LRCHCIGRRASLLDQDWADDVPTRLNRAHRPGRGVRPRLDVAFDKTPGTGRFHLGRYSVGRGSGDVFLCGEWGGRGLGRGSGDVFLCGEWGGRGLGLGSGDVFLCGEWGGLGLGLGLGLGSGDVFLCGEWGGRGLGLGSGQRQLIRGGWLGGFVGGGRVGGVRKHVWRHVLELAFDQSEFFGREIEPLSIEVVLYRPQTPICLARGLCA
jgi:hypothetical protein